MTISLNAMEIASGVRAGALKAEAVLADLLADIAVRDRQLNCFTSVLSAEALSDARRIDEDLKAGRDVGRLAGVPFAVKDLFDVAGRTTHAGSKILRDAPPTARDAAVIRNLKSAGAILVATANMDEFAYGFSTENAHYGTTRNPHDPSKIAGGSSGGSAAAVAASLVPFALGSDTNGSVRVPAALCGVFGMKPTFGRLSRQGMAPFVTSLDHVGHFARSVADLEAVYDCALGERREADASAFDATERAELAAQPARLRVGLLDGWFRRSGSPEALAATDRVAAAFAKVRRIEVPEAERARSAAFCITAAEGGHLHLSQLRERAGDFDPATRDRLIAGALLPAAVYLQAQQFRRWFTDEVAKLFTRFDVLLAPATPCAAPPIGQADIEVNGRPFRVRANLGLYTQPISFIGLPVVTLPVHEPGPMPLGVQLIGKAGSDSFLLALARNLEADGVVSAKPLEASSHDH